MYRSPPPLGTPTERAPTPVRRTIDMKTNGSKKRKKKKNCDLLRNEKQTNEVSLFFCGVEENTATAVG